MTDASKTQLRQEYRQRRRALTPAQREDAEEDAWRAYAALNRPRPDVAAVYAPMGSEFSPERLARWLQQGGVRIVLPVEVADGQPMLFVEADAISLDRLPALRPRPGGEILTPDLVFTPLLAFDRFGGRLGQGRGCYDRTVAPLRAKRALALIGLAFAIQEAERLPMEPHDQRLDGVLTEKGYLPFP